MFLSGLVYVGRLWDGKHMQNVATAIEKGGDTIHHSEEKNGMPHFTLHDHTSGKIELNLCFQDRPLSQALAMLLPLLAFQLSSHFMITY